MSMASTLRLPLALTRSGSMATVEQGSGPEIAQSLALLLDTRPGERAALPDYGWPSPLGGPVAPQDVLEVIAEWEGRALPAQIDAAVAALDETGQWTQVVDVQPLTSPDPSETEIS